MARDNFRGELGRSYRAIGSVASQKSPELQFLESVNARIVFAIAGSNLPMVQDLLPKVSTTKAKELIELGQLFLGVVRDRDTYLHLAAKGNKAAILKFLLDSGFAKDLDARNVANFKPGQYASPAINTHIQQYKSKRDGNLGNGQGVLVAAKLALSSSSAPSVPPPVPPAK